MILRIGPFADEEALLATLKQILGMLEQQRRELLDQLDGIDKAIAALGGAGIEAGPAASGASVEDTVGTVQPRHVKARRVLTDAHKQALVAGRRRARVAQEVAKGIAREMPDDAFVPAIGTRGDRQPPRLIKTPVKK